MYNVVLGISIEFLLVMIFKYILFERFLTHEIHRSSLYFSIEIIPLNIILAPMNIKCNEMKKKYSFIISNCYCYICNQIIIIFFISIGFIIKVYSIQAKVITNLYN